MEEGSHRSPPLSLRALLRSPRPLLGRAWWDAPSTPFLRPRRGDLRASNPTRAPMTRGVRGSCPLPWVRDLDAECSSCRMGDSRPEAAPIELVSSARRLSGPPTWLPPRALSHSTSPAFSSLHSGDSPADRLVPLSRSRSRRLSVHPYPTVALSDESCRCLKGWRLPCVAACCLP